MPKTHQDYWFSRLRKRDYLDRSGQLIEIPNWQVRLKKDGREAWFNLGTANQVVAAKKAKEIFTFLEANRWDATFAKFKYDSDIAPRLNLSVGDYLRAVEATGHLRIRTFLNYQNCFRTILSQAFGIKSDASKYDYRSADNGNRKWAGRVDNIRLERVTPARIIQWQRQRIKEAGHSPAAIASAKRTINSYTRCARSLFSRDIIKQLKNVKLPSSLPFDGVELLDSGSMKYVSKVNVRALIAAAKEELKAAEPEVYKAFLLGLFAGMRRGEIDLAQWNMIDWQNKTIVLEETEWLHLKTHDSAGVITIDEEVLNELRELMPQSKTLFIVESLVTWRNGKRQRSRIRPPRN
ncbi:MAG TPA: hypothetical protein VG754_12355, partial [Verrucomicrobiae bacterium]|nr:hypothetical protein [Verrucomicrobiae bacterium]